MALRPWISPSLLLSISLFQGQCNKMCRICQYLFKIQLHFGDRPDPGGQAGGIDGKLSYFYKGVRQASLLAHGKIIVFFSAIGNNEAVALVRSVKACVIRNLSVKNHVA